MNTQPATSAGVRPVRANQVSVPGRRVFHFQGETETRPHLNSHPHRTFPCSCARSPVLGWTGAPPWRGSSEPRTS